MSADFYIPPDLQEAGRIVEIACGHGALAAALGIGVWQALKLLADKEGWVNMPQMEAALQASGRSWRRLRPQEKFGAAASGVVMVQWLGSWMAAGPRVACQYRHWAATRAGLVWDINWPERWMTKPEWVRRINAELLPAKATGWDVIGKWEIQKIENDKLL